MMEDLAAVDRTVTPWLIVDGQRPIYVDSTFDEGPTSAPAVAYGPREA